MAADEPRPFGAYVLLKALGRGAMGDVHLARPYNPNRGIPTPVVVKRLHGELAKKKGFVARFTHEAEVAVSVESKHVAKVYDAGSVGDTLYITMEYVTGWPLSKVLDAILKSGRHASIASVVDSIAGALEGLEALHSALDPRGKPLGIVHRDISPKNLMIGEDGLIHIIDLGLGKSNLQDWKTRTGVVMGSVGYMPPEQVNGDHVDSRADVYAMGVVAFEMLALRNYIKRGPLPQMMAASVTPKFQKPSEFRPDVPSGLDDVIEKALDPTREGRFQTAGAFLKELRRVVPASHTAGGMRALVDELFGETKIERDRELEALLSLPLPSEDPQEHEPTKVFVQRAGVRADRRDLHPTRESVRIEPLTASPPTDITRRVERPDLSDRTWVDPVSIPPNGDGTRATELASWTKEGSGNFSPRPRPHDPASSDVLVAPVSPFTQQFSATQSRTGISLGVLVASVVLAAMVGAIVAVLVSQRVIEQAQTPTVIPPVIGLDEVERPVVVQQARKETPPPVEDEREVEETIEAAVPAKTKRVPSKRTEKIADNTPPPIEEARPSLEDEARALIAGAEDLIQKLPNGPGRARAMQLKLDLKRDMQLGEDRLRESVAKSRTELKALRASN